MSGEFSDLHPRWQAEPFWDKRVNPDVPTPQPKRLARGSKGAAVFTVGPDGTRCYQFADGSPDIGSKVKIPEFEVVSGAELSEGINPPQLATEGLHKVAAPATEAV